jgi:lon-related putative ATP-dependent protease
VLVAEVPLTKLRPRCDPSKFSFETTAEVQPYVGLIGQDRAVSAIRFGLSIDSKGFNVCVAGQPGTGRTTAIREYIEELARTRPPPDEWCYVNNFQDAHRPVALRFPPGRGRAFCEAIQAMIAEARERIPRTFESEDFVSRREGIVTAVQRRREALFAQLAERARAGGFLLQGNPAGFFLVPMADDRPMDDQMFLSLSQEERTAIMQRRDQLMDELRAALKQEQGAEMEAQERLSELERSIASMVVDSLLDRIFERFAEFPKVIEHLEAVRKDMVANIRQFQRQSEQQMAFPFPAMAQRADAFRKYEANLLVDRSRDSHAPVIFESNPAPGHLLGRIEKEAVFGALTTDFTMIQSGALHRANGGFLVIDLDDLLVNPISWSELKRVLRTGNIMIEEMSERLGFLETKTLRPEPIPWTGKVVALAREEIYRGLYSLDPDFRELFKVKADFDLHIDRTEEHEMAYAGLIAAVSKREDLLPFDRAAVARIVEEGMRLADDHTKLSIKFGELTDVMREASFYARNDGKATVGEPEISRAVIERVYRVNLIEAHVREAVSDGIIVVATDGTSIGQVNGLSVVDLGDTAFGQPSRITVSLGIGREGLIDLQREARLAGPIHTKAVLTIQGFLVDRYAADRPLTLAARVSFEQSYGMIEGDSATCAEVCALLSRIAGVPVSQSWAITGSMDQRGDVQAVGGVNPKIEGFFDVCRNRGLTGEQGVIIPASNIQHLMLREDVVRAVEEGRFLIQAISKIDEALELLTGIAVGERLPDGTYPADTLNGKVLAQLKEINEKLRESGELRRRDEEEEKQKQEAREPATAAEEAET